MYLFIISLPFQNIPNDSIIRQKNHNNDVLSIKAKYDNGFSVMSTSFAKNKQINGEIIPIIIESKIYIFLIYFTLLTIKFDVISYIIPTIYYNVFKNRTNKFFE